MQTPNKFVKNGITSGNKNLLEFIGVMCLLHDNLSPRYRIPLILQLQQIITKLYDLISGNHCVWSTSRISHSCKLFLIVEMKFLITEEFDLLGEKNDFSFTYFDYKETWKFPRIRNSESLSKVHLLNLLSGIIFMNCSWKCASLWACSRAIA